MGSRVALGRFAIGTVATLTAALFSVVAAETAVAAGGSLTVSGSSPIVGERVTAQGRVSTHVVRRLELQQKIGSSWATRAKGKSTAKGTFEFALRAPSSPGKTAYRVLAPRVQVRGRTYRAIHTTTSVVHALGQTSALSVPATDEVGDQATATTTFTPARPGRTVTLQRQVSGSWTTIASSTEDATGTTTMTFTPSGAGSYLLRAVAAAADGAAAAATTSQTVTVTARSTWLRLSTDADVWCGVKTDHTGWCWGDNGYGAVGPTGDDYVNPPLQLSGSWTSITTNGDTTCGLRTDGTGWCWGERGDGSDSDFPTELPGTWTTLYDFDCGIRPDQTAWCWGSNNKGQLGIGDPTVWRTDTPHELPGHWSELAAGGATKCGVQTDGTGWCWGDDSADAIGDGAAQDGTAPAVYSPFELPGTGWSHIVTSGGTSCGARGDGTGWCWGQLPGDGSDGSNTPTQVPGSWVSFSAVSRGPTGDVGLEADVCGVQTDHTGWCWGANDLGQLGDGSTEPYGTRVTSPVQVPGSWSTLSTNAEMGCGIKTDDTAACWGYDYDGQVGDGTSGTGNSVLSPVTLPGTWSSISDLPYHSASTCGIQPDGTGWCWGRYIFAIDVVPFELP